MLRAEPYTWDVVSAPDRARWSRISSPTLVPARASITVWDAPSAGTPQSRLSHVSAYVFAGNPHPASSRIRPANDRETSRNGGTGWKIKSAGQGPDSSIAAGSEIGPENTLKKETPHLLLIPLGE